MDEFTKRLATHLAKDHSGALVYLAPTVVSLNLTQERWPKVEFRATREHRAAE
jgi:peptide chain release factor 3